MIRRAFLLLVLASCARGPVKRPDGGEGLLPVGSQAPDFVSRDPKGYDVRLSDQRGHAAVVYFYPKDGTPGCTSEACAFRDSYAKYEAMHVTLIGVSRDSEESHRAFIAKHHLPFALASDESGAIEKSYGVGSTLGMSNRVTFLIGPDGRVAQVWPDVDPGVHASEVLAAAGKFVVDAGVGQGGE